MDNAAVARMLDLTNVLELIIDRLAQGSFAQEYFVEHRHQLVLLVKRQKITELLKVFSNTRNAILMAVLRAIE
jgi:hypothetical protein